MWDRQDMGESLFGKLRGVLARETTSDIEVQEPTVSPGANLARIGLATGNLKESVMPQDGSSFAGSTAVPAHPGLPTSSVEPVGIQFFAELPTQECATEISSVSQRAENCLSTEAKPVGDGVWSVAVTLSMAPVPHEIYAIESVLQTWAQKMGGVSKGWGLSQNHAA